MNARHTGFIEAECQLVRAMGVSDARFEPALNGIYSPSLNKLFPQYARDNQAAIFLMVGYALQVSNGLTNVTVAWNTQHHHGTVDLRYADYPSAAHAVRVAIVCAATAAAKTKSSPAQPASALAWHHGILSVLRSIAAFGLLGTVTAGALFGRVDTSLDVRAIGAAIGIVAGVAAHFYAMKAASK